MALLDVENLVEGSRNVESEGIHLVEHLAAHYLLQRQPLLVRESEFQFVPVTAREFAPEDGHAFRELHLADALQVVHHLFLFPFQLFVIGEYLPFAASADTIVRTKGFGTVGAEGMELHGLAFGETVFLATQLYVHDVSGYDKGNEDGHAVDACKGLAFSSDIGDKDFFE